MEYLYEAPLAMEREKLADVVLSSLRLENRKPDLSDWEEMVESLRNPNKTVKIAIVGKYTQLHDAYLSVVEALKHGGISCRAKVELDWIDSEELTEKNLDQQLHNVDGILVPGGFGNRGTEGMILAAQYAGYIDSISWNLSGNADGNRRICPPCTWIRRCKQY